MDEQNNQSSQNNPQNPPAEIPPAYVPPETPPPIQPAPTTPQPVMMPMHSETKKKPTLLIICVVIALLLAVGLPWLYILYSKNAPQKQEANTSQQDKVTTSSQPDQLVYYRGDGVKTPYTLYARSIASGDEIETLTLPDKMTINSANAAIQGSQVAFVALPGDDAKDKGGIYYSSDSGKSYKRIYTPETTGVQITSLIFSTDGKTLLAGLLTAPGDKNEVSEISLEGGAPAKVIFTSDDSGVFLKGYDTSKQQVLYFTGCYNCDAFSMGQLYSYDIAAKKQETLYKAESSDIFTLSTAVNKDFTKVLVLEGKRGDGYTAITKAPYTLFAITIATKTKESIKTFDTNETLNSAGYTVDGDPYVTTNTKVEKIADDKLSTLFDLSGKGTYMQPLFVGTNGVVANVTTSSESGNPTFAVNYAKAGNATPSEFMKENSGTGLLGVTYK